VVFPHKIFEMYCKKKDNIYPAKVLFRAIYFMKTIENLREYLSVRLDFELEGRKPLVITDYGNRFNRKEIID
jgi:hypothetical protein